MKRILSIILCFALIVVFIPTAFAEDADAIADNTPVITKQPDDILMSYEDTLHYKSVSVDISAYIPNGDNIYYEVYRIDENNKQTCVANSLKFSPSTKDYTYFVRAYDKNEFGSYADSDVFAIKHAEPSTKEKLSERFNYIMYGVMFLSAYATAFLLSPLWAPVVIIFEMIKSKF